MNKRISVIVDDKTASFIEAMVKNNGLTQQGYVANLIDIGVQSEKDYQKEMSEVKKYKVSVEKRLTVTGIIEIEAENAEAAQEQVDQMMVSRGRPAILQTNDSRIEWDVPEFDGGSFQTTGDVEDAD